MMYVLFSTPRLSSVLTTSSTWRGRNGQEGGENGAALNDQAERTMSSTDWRQRQRSANVTSLWFWCCGRGKALGEAAEGLCRVL